jgi:hypothetical protein
MGNRKGITIHKPKTRSAFNKLNAELNKRGMFAIDALKPGLVRSLTIGDKDPSKDVTNEMAASMGCGAWSNGPLSKVAWNFDTRDNTVHPVSDKDGKPLGLGYVDWGPGNSTPSVIPPLAMSLPYTASPLRYLADLTAGLGPRLMYRLPDGELVEYKDAGELLQQRIEELEKQEQPTLDGTLELLEGVATGGQKNQKESYALKRAREAYNEWERSWLGHTATDRFGIDRHVAGAKEFLENNNLNLHLSQCMQDNVMLDIYFPTIGFDTKGVTREWAPAISRVGFLPAHSTRLEKMDDNRFIHHCYLSDKWRTLGIGAQMVTAGNNDQKIAMYQAAMPQNLLHELRYIVESNQKKGPNSRPMWVVCPTYYPSLNKPYYPQPAWWSIFSSKAFDFASTILYDKYKQRENNTTWSRILYVSLDYLNMMFGDMGIEGDKDAQEKFIDELDANVDDFLKQRDNMGKTMRQFMWVGPDGKEHHNVEVVDIKEATNDAVKAGKEELELSTSPIFLALGVDPRLVGVPMVAASNGGTALREMHLLKQQQLTVHKRNYEHFLNTVATYNGWARAEFHILDQTLTTLDNSKTGTVETISSQGA